MSQRKSMNIETAYLIMRGLIHKGIVFYGNFPEDTITIMAMNKETVTHGEDT